MTLCPIDVPAPRRLPHNVMPGSPGTDDEVNSPGAVAGRRRPSSVVAALQSTIQATTLLGRRWGAGTPGRSSVSEGR